MTDINALIGRIDQEIAAEVLRRKTTHRFQVQRRLRQTRVIAKQKRGTQKSQTFDRTFEQSPNERLCGCVSLQCVQAALDYGSSRFVVHGEANS